MLKIIRVGLGIAIKVKYFLHDLICWYDGKLGDGWNYVEEHDGNGWEGYIEQCYNDDHLKSIDHSPEKVQRGWQNDI